MKKAKQTRTGAKRVSHAKRKLRRRAQTETAMIVGVILGKISPERLACDPRLNVNVWSVYRWREGRNSPHPRHADALRKIAAEMLAPTGKKPAVAA